MTNKLVQLKSMTSVVADTGDVEAIEKFTPLDATTNPSLLLKAAALPHYRKLVDEALTWSKQQSSNNNISLCVDYLAVAIGAEILKTIPGRISTEVDARLSFNTAETVAKAHQLIDMYQQRGIDKSRVLIKIASTWEGIKAAEELEKEGINCNLTLLFNFAQAVACAEAGVFLISPFVGRILDWFKANSEQKEYTAEQDPGVVSVSRIYHYYKSQGYNTVVMGASFRNIGEIEQLAGCDKLTISPALLQALEADNGTLQQQLDANKVNSEARVNFDQASFRWAMNQDPMATEKLSEGIRNFAADQDKLEAWLLTLDV
ncbi:Transaldolase B [Sinobacterium norvegicum]|uniref:Transaldolase n=1 Tax=Sinobacterium norvegicum TaxID=1641715 RepID=A0ABN8EDH5_9GAMM|nr:transaldolase [Sinobacterium norvegicum]CAH0990516.1 Transaldolase B [Sinobacterium norvegicum]